MSFMSINPLQTATPQSKIANSTAESNSGAFQKVLEKQFNHAESQKNSDEVAKPDGDIAQEDSSINHPASKALADQAQPSQDRIPVGKNAQNTAHMQHKNDRKIAPNEKASTGKKLTTNENLKDSLDLIRLPTDENSEQSAVGINSLAQDTTIPNEIHSADSQDQNVFEMAENPLLPMLNMMNITSTIQSKLNTSEPALDNKSSLESGNVGFENAKTSGTAMDLGLDQKLVKQPAEAVENDEMIGIAENHQTGSNPAFSEALRQQANVNKDLEVKFKSIQESSTLPVAANSSMAAPVLAATFNSPQTVVSNDITHQLGGSGWNEAISQKVIWMIGTEQQSATLTLNPPDLGPLQVVIQVHNEQANTTFISQNPEVRQALADGLDNLRNMMASAGIQLGQANVHDNQPHQHAHQPAQTLFSSKVMPEDSRSTVSNTVPKVHISNGLVDTFV